jgi:anaerobic magnesium-protoporphyrin IX monomethyl ester cyclase
LVIHLFVLSLFPGTRLYEEYQKRMKISDDIWLNKIEDIKYFETDPDLSAEDVLSFGKTLRTGYHELIPEIVDTISLVDNKELYPLHADFCSRLGMTFDHGDYAHNDAIKGKEEIAEKLYNKALAYSPHPSAYLGLGILNQKKSAYDDSIKILSEGLRYFPDNEPLNICLGVSHMNIGDFSTALSMFLKFQHSKQALRLIVDCYRELNDNENASIYHQKLVSTA